MEIEAKLAVASHDPVREKLMSLGAAFVRAGIETNVILDRPDRSLMAAGMGLRVRSVRVERGEPALSTLTAKGPPLPGPLKRREEIETTVGDAETTLRLLAMLGYQPVLRYEKRRESWLLGGCQIELDEPPLLGSFVEIEGCDEPTIARVQRQLGLADAPHEPRSYVEMLITRCRELGRSPLSVSLA